MSTQQLEKILQNINDWIKTADQKISIIFAFFSFISAATFSVCFQWVTVNIHKFDNVSVTLLIVSLFLMIYSLLKLLIALLPSLNKNGFTDSLIFFGDISKNTLIQYKKKVDKAKDNFYRKDLQEQIYINSKIANRKHILFQDAVILSICSVTLMAINSIYFYINNYGI